MKKIEQYKTTVRFSSITILALVLTAIVIGFATTAFIVQLALRSRFETGTDHVDSKEELPQIDPREDEP